MPQDAVGLPCCQVTLQLMSRLLPTMTPVFPAEPGKLSSQPGSPSLCPCQGLFLPRGRSWHLSFADVHMGRQGCWPPSPGHGTSYNSFHLPHCRPLLRAARGTHSSVCIPLLKPHFVPGISLWWHFQSLITHGTGAVLPRVIRMPFHTYIELMLKMLCRAKPDSYSCNTP